MGLPTHSREPTITARLDNMTFFAYLDPVTGSAIVQVLLGALAVIGLGWQYVRRAFRMAWSRISGESVPRETSAVVDVEPSEEAEVRG